MFLNVFLFYLALNSHLKQFAIFNSTAFIISILLNYILYVKKICHTNSQFEHLVV